MQVTGIKHMSQIVTRPDPYGSLNAHEKVLSVGKGLSFLWSVSDHNLISVLLRDSITYMVDPKYEVKNSQIISTKTAKNGLAILR